jgi:GT2 family glycosyltransferase
MGKGLITGTKSTNMIVISGWLRRFCRLSRVDLVPIDDEGALETGSKRFTVENHGIRRGWYMIELRAVSAKPRGEACFFFEDAQGETTSLTLPFQSGRMRKRLFCVSAPLTQVRLEVKNVNGFELKHLMFVPVSAGFARNRMIRRLRNRVGRYETHVPAAIRRQLKRQARQAGIPLMNLLLRLYNYTFMPASARDQEQYAAWIELVEIPERMEAMGGRHAGSGREDFPAISVVMPVWNPPENFLRRALESVLQQSYPHWQLCVVDDASDQPHVRRVLEEYAALDNRIEVVFRAENGHFSVAGNDALKRARGDWVTFLDHDDELAEHALCFMAEATRSHPDAGMIYSDEDKIDGEGQRFDPLFKPDWNPDLFFSQNYVAHLTMIRRDLLERVGGFRTGVEGSQDYDLVLRCLPHLRNKNAIVHLPRILYHWRVLPGSTALSPDEKDYSGRASLKALQDYVSDSGRTDITVEKGLLPDCYRLRYSLPDPPPLVSLLIPTRDQVDILEICVRSILEKTRYPNYEIMILDNDSQDPATLDFLDRIRKETGSVRVLRWPHPFNYSAINNFGVRHAAGSLIGLVNNDIEVISSDWLTEMASHAVRPDIGCVGAKLYYPDDTIQHGGVILGLGGVAGHSHKYADADDDGYLMRLKVVQNLSAVTAACLLVKKEIYEAVGGLDEDNLKIAFNDVDFCLKVREAGYRNLWTPYAELYHHESRSRGMDDTPEKQARFRSECEFMQRKWGDTLKLDPMYSPHLTQRYEDFSLNLSF